MCLFHERQRVVDAGRNLGIHHLAEPGEDPLLFLLDDIDPAQQGRGDDGRSQRGQQHGPAVMQKVEHRMDDARARRRSF